MTIYVDRGRLSASSLLFFFTKKKLFIFLSTNKYIISNLSSKLVVGIVLFYHVQSVKFLKKVAG